MGCMWAFAWVVGLRGQDGCCVTAPAASRLHAMHRAVGWGSWELNPRGTVTAYGTQLGRQAHLPSRWCCWKVARQAVRPRGPPLVPRWFQDGSKPLLAPTFPLVLG